MIEELRLQNFQSYKRAKIKFSSGFNAIIGSTGAGKSRITKAIQWVARNKPKTIKVYPKKNKKATTKAILKTDGNVIRRIKSQKTNAYILIDKNKKKKVFKAFGSKVPEDIKKVVNMLDLNFQRQHDAPFLLSISPGARARYLNKTIDLDIIDRSQKNISTRIQREQAELARQKSEAKEIKKKLKNFDWISEAEVQLRKAEITQRKINHLEDTIKDISSLVYSIEDNRKEIRKLKKITKFKKVVKELIAIEEEIERMEDEREEIERILSSIKDIRKEVSYYKDKKKRLQAKFNKLMKGRCPLCKRKF